MKRTAASLTLIALVFPSVSLGATCIERNESCSLGELMEINTNAQTIGLTTYEHIAVLLEIITHLRRIITTFEASSQVSGCLELQHDLRPGMNDAKTEGEVSALQHFLSRAGVYDELVTGYYGPVTGRAVYLWQLQNGISGVDESTGVGKITREKVRLATCATLDS